MSQLNSKLLIKPSQGPRHLSQILRDPIMPQPQINFANVQREQQRSGMTLIELLVAIGILVIIAAILVPQLRFATADRNRREASRLVASVMAQASQRAVNDGEAGVVIERNPNIISPSGNVRSYFAGTSLFLLRKVPNYTGEDLASVAEVARNRAVPFPTEETAGDFSLNEVFIPLPLDQESLGTIRATDQISFAGQPNIRFNIQELETQTDPGDGIPKLRLLLGFSSDFFNIGTSFPDPEITSDSNSGNNRKLIGSFVVHRQPRKLVSSRVDLPTGYLIDLRLSGETDPSGTQMLFDLDNRAVGTVAQPNSIIYLFNGGGSIDRFYYSLRTGPVSYPRQVQIPSQPAYLMVREYNTDISDEFVSSILSSDSTMWVTVDPVTGATNVVPGVAVDPSTFPTLRDALRGARILSSQGQAAQ